MSKISESLVSPEWWFSVVIVGLIINVASSYLKALIDALMAKVSARRRRALSQRKDEDRARLALLILSETERTAELADEIRSRFRAQAYVLMAGVFWMLGVFFFDVPSNGVLVFTNLSTGVLVFFIAVQEWRDADLHEGRSTLARTLLEQRRRSGEIDRGN